LKHSSLLFPLLNTNSRKPANNLNLFHILCFCWVLQVDLKVDFLKSMMIATQTKWVMRFLKIFGFEKKNYDGKQIVFEDIFIKTIITFLICICNLWHNLHLVECSQYLVETEVELGSQMFWLQKLNSDHDKNMYLSLSSVHISGIVWFGLWCLMPLSPIKWERL
jgi:hypothetical protein